MTPVASATDRVTLEQGARLHAATSSSRRRAVPPVSLGAVVFLADLSALTVVMARAGASLAAIGVAQAVVWTLAPFRPPLSQRCLGGIGRLAIAVAATHFALDAIGRRLDATVTAALLVLLAAERALIVLTTTRARRRGRLQTPSLVVGHGPLAEELLRALCAHPEYGCLPVHRPRLAGDTARDLKQSGINEMQQLVDELGIRRVFLVDEAARTPPELSCDVYIAISEDASFASGTQDHVWGIPMRRLSGLGPSKLALRAKRVVDVTVAALGLVLSAPLLAVCALAVKMSGPGPVFFRQVRVGEKGRPIRITKFRTMREAVELDLEAFSAADANGWQCLQHAEARSRTTRIGRLLRTTSLDELPQLLDILRGDLSLVGPRPELPHMLLSYSQQITGYATRLRMPAGLTGWAQIHGLRGETSLQERARFDNYYIDTWSFARDMQILVVTFAAVVRYAAQSISERFP